MRNLKRVLSLAIAAVMLIGMMVVGTSAKSISDFADGDQVTHEEAVSVILGLGIMGGMDETTFAPNGNLTRAQMTVILSNLIGGTDAESFKVLDVFPDVPSTFWGAGYINKAQAAGVVSGRDDGKFHPDDKVTVAEAATMIMAAMGVQYDTANWPIGVMSKGAEIKLFDGVIATKDTVMTRDMAATYIFNGITKYSPSGAVSGYKVTVGGTEVVYDSIIDAYFANGGTTAGITVAAASDTLAATRFKLTGGTKDDGLGHTVKTWTQNGTVIYTSTDSIDAPSMTVPGEDFVKATTLKDYTLDGTTKYYYNGVERTAGQFDMDGARGATIEVYCTGTHVDKILATEAYFVKVDKVETNGDVKLKVYEAGYAKNHSGNPADVTIKKTDSDYDLVKDMAAKDVFMGVFNTGNWAGTDATRTPLLKVEAVERTEGKVTASKIKLNATVPVYSQSSISINGSEWKFSNMYGRAAVDLGSEGTFYLYNGYVVYFTGKTEVSTPTQYAVVLEYGMKVTGAGSGLDAATGSTEYQARLLFTDGTARVVVINKFGAAKGGGGADASDIVLKTIVEDSTAVSTDTATKIAYDTGVNISTNKGIFVSYTEDNGKYALTPVVDDDDLAVVAKGNINGIKNNSAIINTATDTTAVIGNANTVFLTAIGTARIDYAAVTGIANAPKINADGGSVTSNEGTLGEFAALTVKGIATYVYVKANKVDGAAQSAPNYAYIKNSVTPTKGYAADGRTQIATVDAYIDGAWTTLSVKVADAATITNMDGLVTYATTGDYVTSMAKVSGELQTMTLAQGGVIVYGTNDTATYDADTVIYKVADDDVSRVSVEDLEAVDATTVKVVVVEDANEAATLIWIVPNA